MGLIRIQAVKAYIMGIMLLLFIIANFIMQAVRRHPLQMTFYAADQHSNVMQCQNVYHSNLCFAGSWPVPHSGIHAKAEEAALRSELPNMLMLLLVLSPGWSQSSICNYQCHDCHVSSGIVR